MKTPEPSAELDKELAVALDNTGYRHASKILRENKL